MSDQEKAATHARRKLMAEREEWLNALDVDRKEEMLFELEMLLKAVDRFFNLDNLPIAQMENVLNRNFSAELRMIRNAAARISSLTQGLLAREDFRLFHFESFLETKILKDHTRDVFMQRYLEQNSPRESLFILSVGFENLLEVLSSLIKLKHVSYQLFFHTGQLVSRQIVANKYFNPFRLRAFLPRFDKISNQKIIYAKNRVKDGSLKKNITIPLLAFYRILHYIQYTDENTSDIQKLKDNLLVFSLVSSEANSLISFIEVDLLRDFDPSARSGQSHSTGSGQVDARVALLSALDTISFQLRMEMKKVFKMVLRDFSELSSSSKLRVAVESAKGILKNFSQQAIVSLARSIDPAVRGEDIFPDFVSRLEQSVKLREDIWMLSKVIEQFECVLSSHRNEGWRERAGRSLSSLLEFISYFESFSLNNVRYADREGFVKFMELFESFTDEDLGSRPKLAELANNSNYFRIFLETTLAQLRNRTELAGIPLDEEKAMENLTKYLMA